MGETRQSEEQLLDRAMDGDRDALGTLLVRYHGKLRRTIESDLSPDMRRRVEVEGIVERTFESAFRHIDTFDTSRRSSFFVWLKAIARNRTLDAIKSASRKKRGGDRNRISVEARGSKAAPSLGSLQPESDTPSRHAARAEMSDAIRNAIRHLNDSERLVFSLRYHEQLDWDDIANRMERSKPAARALYRRTLDKIREKLGHLSNYL